MSDFNRQHLHAYLDDALSDAETARFEQELRRSEPLREQLKAAMQERDRGEHSLGAIWRRERLSCPTREQLGSYLLEALDGEFQEYIRFHLETIACPCCLANLADLQTLRREVPADAQQRRRRFYDSSAGFLTVARSGRG
jgi:hypothetical protein